MESNKVKVRIYGQEYTIAGEKDEESIKRIASHVNENWDAAFPATVREPLLY